jgi:hypothetical protein
MSQDMPLEEVLDHIGQDLAENMYMLTQRYKGYEMYLAHFLARQLGAYVSIVSKDNDNGKYILQNLGAVADVVRAHNFRQTRADHFGYKELGVDQAPKSNLILLGKDINVVSPETGPRRALRDD